MQSSLRKTADATIAFVCVPFHKGAAVMCICPVWTGYVLLPSNYCLLCLQLLNATYALLDACLIQDNMCRYSLKQSICPHNVTSVAERCQGCKTQAR